MFTIDSESDSTESGTNMRFSADFFFAHPVAIWVVIALLAAIIEISVPSFSFIFVAGAALLTAPVACYFPWSIQLISFAVFIVLLIASLRPYLMRHFQFKIPKHKMPSRAQIQVGQDGTVTVEIDETSLRGRIHVADEDWAACASHSIARGAKVRVMGHDGILLVVEEI